MSNKQKNAFDITGKVIFVGMPIYITEKFSKRLLVIQVFAGKYSQEVAFDYVNDNMPMLDMVRINDWVSLDFELRGRKNIQTDGKARWFINLNGNSLTVQDNNEFSRSENTAPDSD